MNLWKKLFPRKMTSEIGSEKMKGNELTYENKASAIWHDVFTPYTNDRLWAYEVAFRPTARLVLEDRLAASFRKMSDGELHEKSVFLYKEYREASTYIDFELKLVEVEQKRRKMPLSTLPTVHQPNLANGGYTCPVLGGAAGIVHKGTTVGDLRDVRLDNHGKRIVGLEDRVKALEGKQVGPSNETRGKLDAKTILWSNGPQSSIDREEAGLIHPSEPIYYSERSMRSAVNEIRGLKVERDSLRDKNEELKTISELKDVQILGHKAHQATLKARISELESKLVDKSTEPSVPLSAIRGFLNNRSDQTWGRPTWVPRSDERTAIREFLDRYDS